MRDRIHRRAGAWLAAALPVLVSALLLLPIACSPETGEGDAPRSAEPVVRTPERAAPPAPVRSRGETATLPDLPPSGGVVIVRASDTVTVMANQVLVSDLLERLSREFEFELVLLALEDRPVDVLAVGADVRDVLAQALEGIPYTVRYEAREGRSRLAFVTVGEGSERAVARAEDEPVAGPADPRERQEKEEENAKPRPPARRPEPADPEERARFLAGRADREAARRAQVLDELESVDAETRRDAVQMLDPDVPADVDRLARIFASDDDPRVRIAALEQLELSESSAALATIRGALSDDRPEVVVAGLKALRLRADPSVAPRLQPLLEHENREVREQARALAELLEESEASR